MKINYDDCIKVNYVKEKLKLKRMIPKTYEILKKYNCYIAGGAITSLFTEKEINDIDILSLVFKTWTILEK